MTVSLWDANLPKRNGAGEIAQLNSYLTSQEASCMTGISLAISGRILFGSS
jgi:hypothetical protein